MKKIFLVIMCIFSFSSCFALESKDKSHDLEVVVTVVTDEEITEEEIIKEETAQEETEEKDLLQESIMLEDSGTLIPEEIEVSLKYDKYFINYDYIVANKGEVNIRESPALSGNVIRTASMYEKLNLYETVKGEYIEKYGSDVWYHVYWWQNEEQQFGFILSSVVEMRKFQFDKMYSEIEKMEAEAQLGRITYVNNYKNRAGYPPRNKGRVYDDYGNRRAQSAPGYFSLSNKENFIYIEDGSLLRVLDDVNGYYKVLVENNGLQCWVPKVYLKSQSLNELKKIVIIDRNNQNEGVFEKTNQKWVLVSYTLATTGANAKYKIETPLGYYYVIEKREKFIYLNDVTKVIAGYAPYAVRFTGGTYIHGIPVNYKITGKKRIDPGHIEYTSTIGTTPLSHRCVRNYTSHAKFLYDWVEIGKTIVIVIE